ncbi:MAG TPA: gliding motility lipoprotein GldB, partial [Bacteroidia bacterium]|nr:gliding motility lipoprotein GldB [Bacteroidia bacterium]
FSADPNVLLKYAGEGPSTGGFPKESPGNIALYIGWRIVESYMERHPDVSIRQLLEEKDLNRVYQESGYKPHKP